MSFTSKLKRILEIEKPRRRRRRSRSARSGEGRRRRRRTPPRGKSGRFKKR